MSWGKTDYESAAQEILKKHGIDNAVSNEFPRDDGGAISSGSKSSETQYGCVQKIARKGKTSFSVIGNAEGRIAEDGKGRRWRF